MLQIVAGVEPDETEEQAVERARAMWHAEADVNGAIVLVEPLHTVEDIDPVQNEGYSRAVNVCGNVLVRS